MLRNDFLSTEQRPPAAEIELLNLYLDGIDEDYRNQTILRRRITEFFTDEGFFYPIFRQSVDRDRLDVNTFVYKFDIDSQGSKQINDDRSRFEDGLSWISY